MNCNNCVSGCVWVADKFKPRYFCCESKKFMNKHELMKNRECIKFIPSMDKVIDE